MPATVTLRMLAARNRARIFPVVVKRTRYATENMRRYLAEATIPTIARYDRTGPFCLPLPGQRTHKNKLKVRHNVSRGLGKVRRYDAAVFDGAVLAYHKRHIYGRNRRPFAGKDYKHRKDEACVLPSEGPYTPEAKYEDIPYPCTIEETCRWVLERPVKTMQRAVHVAFPDTTRWWLDDVQAQARTGAEDTDTTRNRDRDESLWRTYVWRFHPDEYQRTWWRDVPHAETETEEAPHESMVLAVQPPWILGPQDLTNVSECTGLPSYTESGTPPRAALTASQRVWAKLHDTCKSLNCPAFALTNYHGWVFGRFSDDWTGVRTSEVKKFDANAPNVMQILVYWVGASMGLAGTTFELDTHA